ncbi:MAG: SNF2-related protein [Thermodesulfovibrionales bacterium]|nr:SNF2-related protein [Thermodesulfovibrionales bacterium]
MNRELTAALMPNGIMQLEWIDSDTKPDAKADKGRQVLEKEIYRRFQEDIYSALLFLGLSDREIPLSVSLEFWRNFTGIFAAKLRQVQDIEQIREKIHISLEGKKIKEVLEKAPFMTGAEYLDEALLKFLWSRVETKFRQMIKGYDGTVEGFLKTYSPDVHLIGRVYFHLVENRKTEEYPFAFLATYSTSLSKQGRSRHIPLKFALEEYRHHSQELLDILATIHLAAKKSDLVADLLDSGEVFHPLAWTPKDAFKFLKEIAIYEDSGILCRIPDWWKGGASSFKLVVAIGNTSPNYLGMDSILNFDAQILLGDTVITEKEARRILEESEGLAYIKGKWVEVNSEKLNQVLDLLEKTEGVIENGGLSLKEAMKMQLGAKSIFGDIHGDGILEVSNGEWLESVIAKLRNPAMIKPTLPGKGFKAKLRLYQQNGLNWLHFLHSLQFGACLADDMGLGKTVQILAFLDDLKTKKTEGANLLIIPASLLSNWQNEIIRFAPSLKFFIAHTGVNSKGKTIMKDDSFIDRYDLIITTYSLIQKYEAIKSYSWNYVILDEAQAIKNPGTKQARAVKRLKSRNRIVLTGTLIENSLSDLWSLYDFINPGLLGTSKEFAEYAQKIKNDSYGYGRLKKVISPYILRRLKTDKSVISDLPDKIEMKTYSGLTKRQIVSYKKTRR